MLAGLENQQNKYVLGTVRHLAANLCILVYKLLFLFLTEPAKLERL